MQDAARAKGVELPIVRAGTKEEIDAAFASMVELKAGAVVIGDNPFFNTQRSRLVALSARYALPTISAWREFPASGGLISYGASLPSSLRQLGIYTGKILSGVKPADLPVEQPAKFELVINLKTANALVSRCRSATRAPTRSNEIVSQIRCRRISRARCTNGRHSLHTKDGR
jgi:putative ABC transport system substrate-binding protein